MPRGIRRTAESESAAPAAAPAAVAPRVSVPARPQSLKVMATKDCFYPKDFRRRKGSVFVLRDASHFSDASKERILKRLDKDGNPIKTNTFGCMVWVDEQTPERAVTAEDANNEAMAARMVGPDTDSVI